MSIKREKRARAESFRGRRLHVETLEQRRVLSAAAPWHNDAIPLDVNHDGHLFPSDALQIINRMLQVGIGSLEVPSGTPDSYYDTNGDNMLTPLDLVRVFNGLLRPTEVMLDTLMPFTIDLTPRLEVSVASGVTVADGTPVHLDVDLNNDGQFVGDELDYTVSSMYRGRSEFALGPALPPNDGTETYSINLRARVQNAYGVMSPSVVQPMVVDTQMSDELPNYVNTPDDSYQWHQVFDAAGPGYHYYVLNMTSQTWREGDVNDPVWDHWLKIVVPQGVTLDDTALLYVSGGSNTSSIPTSPDSGMVDAALATSTVTAELKIVPNEDVYFFAEQPINYRGEDDIIAYTYNQYLEHIGEPGNETWPLLLPMVKSAVRAMDTVQTFIPTVTDGHTINNFINTGYSKRGWTTWLTTAVDDRIIASIPGVFDNPNQGPQMVHHYEVLGKFSEEVEPYSNEQIFERLKTPEAQILSRVVDPYRYFQNGKMDKPKLILNAAGDEFFMSDSSQFYFADIPGENNYLRYIPNAGHPLDTRVHPEIVTAGASVVTFMDAIENNRHLPDFSWTVETNGEIHVSTIDTPTQVLLWQATNPVARDFRHGYNPGIVWTSSVLADQGGGTYVGSVPYPATGATAFLVELTFASSVPGTPYVFTTDVRVNSDLPRTPFPYSADASAFNVDPNFAAPAASALPPDAQSDRVVQVFALRTAPAAPAPDVVALSVDVNIDDTGVTANFAPSINTATWKLDDDARTVVDEATADAIDLALGADLDELLADRLA